LGSICDVYLILRNGQLLEYMPNKLTKENIAQIIGIVMGIEGLQLLLKIS
jgi:hypothetical protein